MENAWTERVSDYVDGALDPAEAARFEARMAEDPDLARAVEDVRALVTQAADLDGIDPPDHLWDSIAAQLPPRHQAAPVVDLQQERERRGLSFAGWPAIAAAITLAVISGAMGWILRGEPVPSTDQPVVADTTPRAVDTETAAEPDWFAAADAVNARFEEENAHLAESIRELEEVLIANRENLDEETQAIVEDNLILIDQAIRDAMAALGQDPDSEYLRTHLASSMKRKARLLEDATRLTRREI